SLAPSTLRSYQHAVRHFHKFCDQENIPRQTRTPTPEILLCAFAAEGLGQTSGSTARNKIIAALKAWHSANNWVWHSGDQLAQVLNGIHNMTPSSSIQPKRPPVTIQALELLALYLNHSDPVDVAILACACTGW
ncbi:hypothetical protein P691DRAFT_607720, partial [Macrolepiota fuliginosa MF-IS2]